jgi:hypothetical protein
MRPLAGHSLESLIARARIPLFCFQRSESAQEELNLRLPLIGGLFYR